MSMCSIWKTNMTPPPTPHTAQSSREPERAADQRPTQPDIRPIRAAQSSKTVATNQLVSNGPVRAVEFSKTDRNQQEGHEQEQP